MPYCFECRDEFQDWATVCPDCQVDLVAELSPELGHDGIDEPPVHVATAPNEAIAKMWAGILEEHGIGCLLKRADLQAAMYVFTYDLGCEVHVLTSEAERAKEILAPLLEG